MSKKKKKRVPIIRQSRDLDYFLQNFKETCDKCGETLQAHAYRSRSKSKSEAVYASCLNTTTFKGGRCPRYGLEICFIERIV